VLPTLTYVAETWQMTK